MTETEGQTPPLAPYATPMVVSRPLFERMAQPCFPKEDDEGNPQAS